MNTPTTEAKNPTPPAGSVQPDGSATFDVRLLREDKVWHVWIDGEHACECCDLKFNLAVDRLKSRLSPNDQALRPEAT